MDKNMKLLKIFFIQFLILAIQNLYCMDLTSNQTKLKETLSQYLNEQKYLELTNVLYEQLDKYGNMIAHQWLEDNADSTASVHLLYLQNRQLHKIAKSTDVVFTEKNFCKALKLLLISLIRTKQDIACCLSLDLNDLTKITAKNTYQLFLSKYWHVWAEIIKQGLEGKMYLPSYKNILTEAGTFLNKTSLAAKMPSPAWVICCQFNHYMSWGIGFGSPDETQKQAFNKDFSKTRSDSATQTIQEFSKYNNWADFFFKQNAKLDPSLEKYITKN
jgi:hypothetical protein